MAVDNSFARRVGSEIYLYASVDATVVRARQYNTSTDVMYGIVTYICILTRNQLGVDVVTNGLAPWPGAKDQYAVEGDELDIGLTVVKLPTDTAT